MKIAANDKETYLPYVDLFLEQKTDKDEIIGLRKLEEMASMISPDVPMKYTKRAISSLLFVLWYVVAKKHRSILLPSFISVNPKKENGAWNLNIKATAKLKSNAPYTLSERAGKEFEDREGLQEKYAEFRKAHGDLPDSKPVFMYWWYSEQEERKK